MTISRNLSILAEGVNSSGVLAVTNGGTGVTTLTANAVLIGNGTSAVTAASPTTTGNVLFTADGSTWSAAQKIARGTAVASTSGTSIDFTSLPSWVKRVTVILDNVSSNGASAFQVQLGSGSFTTTGYISNSIVVGGSSFASYYQSTTGLLLTPGRGASDATLGTMTINNISGNTWVASASMGNNGIYGFFGGGDISLSGVLDRVRITTANGTDTFDLGSVNIFWE